ncbi:MAG TPA: hypothetical protein VK541_03990 [Pedobacter sp.]|uniref:hypothetical protein n=1 Tax=Pedobacter sp. TaxID=1411316 RepID=UPI002CD197B3|nr:hypothetical protein [Pedobacter sp.]HMI01615.1 hypothetical protein [Pedobacter sp.]
MKQWIVSYNGNRCLPDLQSENVKTPYPQLIFSYEGRSFFVEFDNRTDYMAARDSNIEVPVMVISANRSKRFKGTVLHKAIELNYEISN